MALFGDGGRARREPRSVVEFRAGKMRLSGTTVSPDTRKGLVFMKLEDNLMHFCWKDRISGTVEDDFIVFPGDAEMKRISQCTTGRVFLLKFKETNRKYFYWLQEPKEDKDEEFIKKVNDYIENPTSALSSSSGGGEMGRRGFPPGLMSSQLQSLLQGGSGENLTQNQLLELLALSQGAPLDILTGGAGIGGRSSSGRGESRGAISSNSGGGGGGGAGHGSSGHSEPPPRQQTPRQRLQLGDLQSALESLQVPPSASGEEEERVTLQEVITSDVLRPLSREETVQDELSSHLPPTNEDTESAFVSPQFQQAMGVFSSALSSGQLGPLVTEFGLSEDVATAAATGSVERFVQALEEDLKEKENEEGKKQEEEDEGREEGGSDS